RYLRRRRGNSTVINAYTVTHLLKKGAMPPLSTN
ncbi:MAG: hypothetical protein ACI80S_001361, partial [Pseudohongiellaceae bacterium]